LALVVVGFAALSTAEPEAKLAGRDQGDLLPSADQWNRLPKESGATRARSRTMATDDGEEDEDEEGSGDDDDDEDGDYFDEDDDDYYDELGSGDSQWDFENADEKLKTEKTEGKEKTVKPSPSDDDIHFEENNHADGALYEYYNELYDEKDYEDDGIDLDGGDYDSARPTAGDGIGGADENDDDKQTAVPLPVFRLSYLYVMLASGVVSFALALLLFLFCRRSALARQEKRRQAGGPFVVSDHRRPAAAQPTPIVKNYQRVPTSAREYLDPPPRYHATVDMSQAHKSHPSEKPLLT